MNSLCLHNANATIHTLHFHSYFHSNPIPSLLLRNTLSSKPRFRFRCSLEINKTKQDIYAPKQNKVVVLWDLDNKPPRGPPYDAALSLESVAQTFGDVVEISAYANRHTFSHLPQWALDRKKLGILERKDIIVTPSEPFVCGVCGREYKTSFDLKKHFWQLHQRERQKKLNRLKCAKGKKRHMVRFNRRNHKYNEAARGVLTPKVGYGLASELRRAGVFVKTVKDKPQAADWALKRQVQHSMSGGIDWLFLVSDDSDFSEMLRRAREEANLGTVVVGDVDRALGRHADLWVPWVAVENGEVKEMDLVPKVRGWRRTTTTTEDEDEDFMLVHSEDEDEDVDDEYYTTEDEREEEDGLYIF